MDILYFQGVRPFRFGGELSWTSFTSKGYAPLGWGGTIMDSLYFQGKGTSSGPRIAMRSTFTILALLLLGMGDLGPEVGPRAHM